jgi:hypothetical protein
LAAGRVVDFFRRSFRPFKNGTENRLSLWRVKGCLGQFFEMSGGRSYAVILRHATDLRLVRVSCQPCFHPMWIEKIVPTGSQELTLKKFNVAMEIVVLAS